MVRNADATRRRILDAATREFAQYGIAGARVDRVAAAAETSKAMIYSYFGPKDELFAAVAEETLRDAAERNVLDVGDLAAYAVALFDYYQERSDVTRLMAWYGLEEAGRTPLRDVLIASTRDKVAAIAEAQGRGVVGRRFPAEELFLMVVALSRTAVADLHSLHLVDADLSRFRSAVADAVRALAEQ